MKRYMPASIAAVIVVLTGTTAAAHAAVTDIRCGAHITQSVTLTHNLTCQGLALTIDPSQQPITVDLGGHIVTSTHDPAILMHGGSTLQHGRIAGKLLLEGGGQMTVTHLVFDGGAVTAQSNAFSTIKINRFINCASIRTSLSSSDIENNNFAGVNCAGIAMDLDNDYATVLKNTVTGYALGIHIYDFASSANVQGNSVSHGGVGIIIGGAPFQKGSIPGTVSRNRVFANSGDGILLGQNSGVPNSFGQKGLITRSNVVRGNGGDGIHIDPTGPGTIIITLTSNTALGNANYGIESPGNIPPRVKVTDGGGNIARMNGNPAQCLNIACGSH